MQQHNRAVIGTNETGISILESVDIIFTVDFSSISIQHQSMVLCCLRVEQNELNVLNRHKMYKAQKLHHSPI